MPRGGKLSRSWKEIGSLLRAVLFGFPAIGYGLDFVPRGTIQVSGWFTECSTWNKEMNSIAWFVCVG
jgi:hypothetical protein